MATKNTNSLILLSLLLLAAGEVFSSAAAGAAFNITQILSKYPDFSSFNDLLSVTGVADEINSRQTITLLAVDNSGIDAVSGRPVEDVKRILSVHVILDYYDAAKLAKLSGKTSLLTTLFQSSGVASNKAGFLNVTDMEDDLVSFGSAVPGAGIGANLVKEVLTKPYDISVLQVSDIIVPPGIENLQSGSPATAPPPKSAATTTTSSPPTTAPPPKTGTSTAAPTKSASPVATPTKSTSAPMASKAAPAPTKTTPAPTKSVAAAPTTTTTAPSPSSGKSAAGPTTATAGAPTSEVSEAPSPTTGVAGGPTSDAISPGPSEPNSGAGRVVAGATVAVVALTFFCAVF